MQREWQYSALLYYEGRMLAGTRRLSNVLHSASHVWWSELWAKIMGERASGGQETNLFSWGGESETGREVCRRDLQWHCVTAPMLTTPLLLWRRKMSSQEEIYLRNKKTILNIGSWVCHSNDNHMVNLLPISKVWRHHAPCSWAGREYRGQLVTEPTKGKAFFDNPEWCPERGVCAVNLGVLLTEPRGYSNPNRGLLNQIQHLRN